MPNFRFELKKLFKSKKLILLILLSIVIPAAVLYQNHFNTRRYAQDLYQKLQTNSADLYLAKRKYQKRISEPDFPAEMAEPAMHYFYLLEEKMQEMISLPREYEFRYEIPKRMAALYNAYLDYAEDRTVNYKGNQAFHMHESADPEWEKSERDYFQRLVDLGLPYEDPVYSSYGLNFAKSVVDNIWGMPLALLLVLLLADVFSGTLFIFQLLSLPGQVPRPPIVDDRCRLGHFRPHILIDILFWQDDPGPRFHPVAKGKGRRRGIEEI